MFWIGLAGVFLIGVFVGIGVSAWIIGGARYERMR
jgi:hypothetical protein